jgi:striatin 1/3/4
MEDDPTEAGSALGEGKTFSDVAREASSGNVTETPASDAQSEGGSTIHVTGADITADGAWENGSPSDNSSVGPLAPIATEDAGLGTDDNEDQSELLTAIYRPESKAAWRDQLRHATEQAERARERSSSLSSNASASTLGGGEATGQAGATAGQTDEEQLHSISLTAAELDDASASPFSPDQPGLEEKTWRSRKILRSHLDIVRSVAFAGTAAGASSHTAAGAAGAAWGKTGGHAGNVVLVSGGDDCTVKVWRIAASSLGSSM